MGAWKAASKLAADGFCVNFIVLLVAACVRAEGVAHTYLLESNSHCCFGPPTRRLYNYRIRRCRVGQIADLS